MAWLGEIPEHWEVLPTRALFDEIKDRDQPDKQMLSVTIKRGVIPQSEFLENTTKKDSSNLDKSNYKLVQPGDIAYNKMRAWQGAIGVSSYLGIISPAYVVQRPRNCSDSRYFHQLFRIPAFAEECERWSYGIASDMWSLRPEHFRLIYSCVPPLAEQAAIVRYLGYVERRIQRYVRTKRKLLGLLAEQKQAIIHRAVTRGLDPDVPLKPSGVEWLGDVPAHWEIRKLKSLMSSVNEQTSQRQNGDLYVALEHIESWTGRIIKTDIDTPFESQVKRFRSGDILFGKLRPYLAKVIRTNSRGVCVSELLVLRPHEVQISVPYMEQLLRTKPIIDTINSSTFGAKMPRANWQFIGRMLVSFPPLPEQTAIAEYLDEITTKIEAVIARIHREIELISEYRTRLIADVVTGKVDVREAVAKLPDEADDVMPDSDTADVLDSDTTFDETVELDMVAELGHEN